jgi:hypothetical protein
MLSFLKKIFGTTPAQPAPVPYKVETPAKVSEFSFPTAKPAETKKKPAVKKAVVKTKPARKPRAPKV